MRKKEIIIISIILVLAVGALLFLQMSGNDEAQKYVKITVAGEVYDIIPLTDTLDTEFTISTELGENHVVIKDGIVNVDWADCKNQVCVKTKSAEELYDTIVCLPHKLIIEIIEEE
ncbi:MAG: NusG domain II-containing protein [Eubacteriales bacterium]